MSWGPAKEIEDPRKMCSTCQRDDGEEEEMELGQAGRDTPCAYVKLAIVHTRAPSKKRSGTGQALSKLHPCPWFHWKLNRI